MSYNSADLLGLSRSKARRALFSLFFTNPEQEYFPRQIERLSGIFVGNLQKELLKMEQAGLLEARRLGQLKLYKLNTRHPLFPELKKVVAKTIGIEGTLREALGRVEGIKAACIYGSFARGEARPASDVDLLVIGEVKEGALIRAVKELEDGLQREINYTLYTDAEWRERKAARDPFVREVLRQPRIPIIGEPDVIR